ncbi:DNA polymerase III, epsilon subunit [Oscillochloris trichoides DG-6]|uniref:3'-5' exonuclease DinG n=1 Tax=Oscillochloris trichoides DG-6 TaxID=765420 RepID=E1IBN7_9CHLR|nr:helicase C-terminal domain-containing protein [Oscillochloris trichoides]EFO81456.1 DNA polymerase III, epsilon subunit [Oscillochloris trichoides DG-6]
MKERIFVALDVETTGLQAGIDEIIEFAAVKFRDGEILERFSQLIAPRQPLPLKITRLTGITAQDLADAPHFNDVGGKIAGFIKSYPLVGHSINFDLGMLRAQGMNFTQPVYDTFDLATILMPQIAVYKLGAIADRLGIPHPDDHRALNDAEVTAHVFTHLLGVIESLGLEDLKEIVRLSEQVMFPMRDLFAHALEKRARWVLTEPRLISVDSRFTWEMDVSPTLEPTNDTRPLDLDAIAQFFSREGALGQAFPGYEERSAQIDMACAVGAAFNESQVLVVEAGTGTGKSWAYLVPAVQYAIQRGERVVVSTNTINLQDQLFFKDIPDLQRIMAAAPDAEPPFRAALLKGRSNYLCLKRYHEVRENQTLQAEEVRALLKIQLWLPTTTSGDKAELLLFDREHNAWNRVNVTTETCIGSRCKHFARCFFFAARREAESAHILVVNHALLLADLTSAATVLPDYAHVVIDEAHNLEDVATDQLSFSIDQAKLIQFLDDLYLEGGLQTVSGLLTDLPLRMGQGRLEQGVRDKVSEQTRALSSGIERTRITIIECFRQITRFMTLQAESSPYDTRLRITDQVRKSDDWETIQINWQYLLDSLVKIGDGLGKIETILSSLDRDSFPNYDDLFLKTTVLNRFVLEVRTRTHDIIFGNPESVCWLTHDRLRNTLVMVAAPLEVAPIMQAQLFHQKQSVVLASATLTIAGSFDFISERIGISAYNSMQLDSPFDFEQQALVFIPNDIAEPNQRGYQQAVEQSLIDLCTATGGRTLALFTANSTLKQTYAAIQEALEEQEIAVLAQGIDGSRRTLLDRFKEFPRTVLLGTSSFWEGVDVVGDALSVLVITKLPFAVPTDPIYAARSELFADPFGEYSVPLSILKFKQGFGRLIRSREDRGIVVILDKRVISKKYGQQFLDSLPHTRIRTGVLKQLPSLAKRFFEG